MTTPATAQPNQPGLIQGLSLKDAVLLLIGGVVGSGIFLTAGQVAQQVQTPAFFISIWLVGGLISLLACFAVAELAGMYPKAGGPYVFLREAFGDYAGFLFGWMLFMVGSSGAIAAITVAFSQYFGKVLPFFAAEKVFFTLPLVAGKSFSLTMGDVVTIVGIGIMTLVNVFGLRHGAVMQNIATWLKFGAIGIFIVLGLAFGSGNAAHFSMPLSTGSGVTLSALSIALISVFFAYDGWTYVTWLASEIKEPQRNVPRALLIGVSIVAATYILMNVVYLYALPLDAIAVTSTIGQDAATALFSSSAGFWLSAAIAVSCFGAASACSMAGARVYYAMAQDGIFFKTMGAVHPGYRTPANSLIWQAVVASLLALSGTFNQLLTYATFGLLASYFFSVIAMFVLRRKRPDAHRPYRCTGYPVLPAIYIVIVGAWMINTIWTQPLETGYGIGLILFGLPLYFFWKHRQTA